MKYAPPGWLAPSSPGKVWNGDAARGLDAAYVDRVLTGLVCARPNQPTMIGQPLGAGTYKIIVSVPPYTQHVAFGIRATGFGGTVEITTTVDPYNTEMAIYATPGEPQWFWAAHPAAVTGDGEARALEVTDQAAPDVVVCTVVVGSGVTVYAIRPVPLPRAPTEALI